MIITTYRPDLKQSFIDLNTAWITRYFHIESSDTELFEHLDELLAKGAQIFFALDDQQNVLAVCMVEPMEEGTWEIGKFAAAHQYTGTGAGSAVFKAARDYAIEQGAKRIILVSNTRLLPALHIYRKYGFHEIPLDAAYFGYERGNIEFAFIPGEDPAN